MERHSFHPRWDGGVKCHQVRVFVDVAWCLHMLKSVRFKSDSFHWSPTWHFTARQQSFNKFAWLWKPNGHPHSPSLHALRLYEIVYSIFARDVILAWTWAKEATSPGIVCSPWVVAPVSFHLELMLFQASPLCGRLWICWIGWWIHVNPYVWKNNIV